MAGAGTAPRLTRGSVAFGTWRLVTGEPCGL